MMKRRHCWGWLAVLGLAWAFVLDPGSLQPQAALAEPVEHPQQLGDDWYRQGDYGAALESYQQALAQSEAEGDRAGIAQALTGLGQVQIQLGNYALAVEYLQCALELWEALGYSASQAVALNILGIAQRRLGESLAAWERHESALAIGDALGDPAIVAEARHNFGTLLAQAGRYSLALEEFEPALALRRQAADVLGESRTLNNLGGLYLLQGYYREALATYEQALALRRPLGDRAGSGRILNNLGRAHRALGDDSTALAHHREALALLQEAGDRASISRTYNSLGVVYGQRGSAAQAVHAFQQALQIARDIGDRTAAANALGNLAGQHAHQGRYAQAQSAYQEALAAYQATDRAGQANTLINLGGLSYALGLYHQALEHLQAALALYGDMGEVDDLPEMSPLQNALGVVYEALEQPDQALAAYQRGLKAAQASGSRRLLAESRDRLGGFYQAQGDLGRAKSHYQAALDLHRQMEDRLGTAATLNNLSLVYADRGDLAQAWDMQQMALAQMGRGDRGSRGILLSNLGVLAERRSQPELAIVFYKQSVTVREAIRKQLTALTQVEQRAYLATVENTYRRLADLLLAQGRVLEAQQVLELLKLEELHTYTEDERTVAGPDQVALLPQEAQILESFETVLAFGQALEACARSGCDRLTQLRDQRDALAREYQRSLGELEALVRDRAATDIAGLHPEHFEAAAEAIIAAQPGTAVIYPVVLDDRLWLLWATEGGVLSRREVRVSRQEIGIAVVTFRTLLEDRHSSVDALQATATQLYQWLIAPLEAELTSGGIQHLVFALDRTTRYIPMAALFDGDRYLVERYTLSTMLSAALTDTSRRTPVGPEVKLLAAGVATGSAGFSALPYVPQELDGIVQEVDNAADTKGVYPGQQLLDDRFSFRALRDALEGVQFLHIATHGQFVAGDRNASYLLMGNGEKLPIPEVEVLKRYLKDVHLVVLSACQTALGGPDEEGLEIAGLGYYFLKSQADAVMASLWNVSDASTSQLMQLFYTNLAVGTTEHPVTKAEALQAAQIALLRSNEPGTESRDRFTLIPRDDNAPRPTSGLAHPYYWAPFILIGNSL